MNDRVQNARPRRRLVALAAGLAAVLAACGAAPQTEANDNRTLPKEKSTPVQGGSITYGIEAETVSGWCLPHAQLAAGGTEVAQAIYETLTVPNAKGEYVPYLAKSIDHSPDYTKWTIRLRDGISFHNGEPFDAAAVVQNLTAYRQGPLWSAAFSDVADSYALDTMTVVVTTRVPWIAFPAYLWGTGRVGMAAPAQLNDPDTCATNLIGTGPFKLESWVPNDSLVVARNPDYWQKDQSGHRLPYLDLITFVPQEDTSQRVNGLKGGDLDLIHLTNEQQIIGLRDDKDEGLVKLVVTGRAAEVSHAMLNVGAPPFDRRSCRLAVAHATDSSKLTVIDDVTAFATQPFARRTPGYQRSPGFPEYDPDEAKQFLGHCTSELGAETLRFTLDSTPDPPAQTLAGALRDQMAEIGIEVVLPPPTKQSQYIDLAVEGRYQAILWRNFAATNPDTLYPWWHSTALDVRTGAPVPNPANLSSINDPVIDRSLERARSEADPAQRNLLYQQIGRQFAKEAYNIWIWYERWAFAARRRVSGLEGPPLPNGHRRGAPTTSVQPVLGLWVRG